MLSITAATSLVISSGSLMGATSATAFRLWVVGFNDAGTFRLGAVDALSGTSIMPLRDDILASSTAEGGAGAADSAQVIYTGVAVTSKPLRILGYLDWATGLTTAGTWASTPTKAQLFGPGVAKPGDVVQVVRFATGAVSTGSAIFPNDDTPPQITEGTQVMSLSLTPSAATNLLHTRALSYTSGLTDTINIAAMFRDSIANALVVGENFSSGSAQMVGVDLDATVAAGSTVSTTFSVRASSNSNMTFNGSSSARKFGGVVNSFIEVWELMA